MKIPRAKEHSKRSVRRHAPCTLLSINICHTFKQFQLASQASRRILTDWYHAYVLYISKIIIGDKRTVSYRRKRVGEKSRWRLKACGSILLISSKQQVIISVCNASKEVERYRDFAWAFAGYASLLMHYVHIHLLLQNLLKGSFSVSLSSRQQ